MSSPSSLGWLFSPSADLMFATFYTIFVLISVTIEWPVCLGYPPSPSSPLPQLRAAYPWCLIADRIFMVRPVWAHVAVCLSATSFAAGYAFHAWAFYTHRLRLEDYREGKHWVTTVSIAWCAVKLYGGALYIAANLMDTTTSPPHPSLFLLQSSSYMIIPALTLLRSAYTQYQYHSEGESKGRVQSTVKRRNSQKKAI
jgi:hypothetical protein